MKDFSTHLDRVFRGDQLFLIAGPCAVESPAVCRRVAAELLEICGRASVQLIFKASYTKANRLSGDSYHGLGAEEGLRILQTIKEEFSIPVLTDVHETAEISAAAEVADVLQIPAFLCRQTELVRQAAATGRWVNIKKGQFLAPEDMSPLVEKAKSNRVLVTERGSSFGYHNLVVDFRSLLIMRESGAPVVFDATHSLQLPGSEGVSSGGQPSFVIPFCRAAVALGVNGLFVETHPEPAKALSDARSMLPLSEMSELIDSVIRIHNVKNELYPTPIKSRV